MGLGGLASLVSLLVASDMSEGTGCFMTKQEKVQNGKTTTCKVDSLICDESYKSNAGIEFENCGSDIPNFKLNATNDAPEAPLPGGVVANDYTISGSTGNKRLKFKNADRMCDASKGMQTEKEKCSLLCKNQYMITDDNENSYDYKCSKRTIAESFKRAGDFASKVLNTGFNVLGGAGDFLTNMLSTIKKYIIYFIIGIVALVIAFKLGPSILQKMQSNSNQNTDMYGGSDMYSGDMYGGNDMYSGDMYPPPYLFRKRRK